MDSEVSDAPIMLYNKRQQMNIRSPEVETPVIEVPICRFEVSCLAAGLRAKKHERWYRDASIHESRLTIVGSTYHAPQRRLAGINYKFHKLIYRYFNYSRTTGRSGYALRTALTNSQSSAMEYTRL